LLLSDFENVSPSVINNSFSGFFDVLLEAVFSSNPLDTSQQSTLHLAQTSMLYNNDLLSKQKYDELFINSSE